MIYDQKSNQRTDNDLLSAVLYQRTDNDLRSEVLYQRIDNNLRSEVLYQRTDNVKLVAPVMLWFLQPGMSSGAP